VRIPRRESHASLNEGGYRRYRCFSDASIQRKLDDAYFSGPSRGTPHVARTWSGRVPLKPIRNPNCARRLPGSRRAETRKVHFLITRYSCMMPAKPSRSIRVLLAEDNPGTGIGEPPFWRKGHSCWVVANGLEALEAVEKDRFDLVFMDVQMPVMDGSRRPPRFERGRAPAESVCRSWRLQRTR